MSTNISTSGAVNSATSLEEMIRNDKKWIEMVDHGGSWRVMVGHGGSD